ncbi:Uncharacterised protein [uncultured archaeon]|nr:Uncharacterised protein [uncultured archaeon]
MKIKTCPSQTKVGIYVRSGIIALIPIVAAARYFDRKCSMRDRSPFLGLTCRLEPS